MSWKYSCKKLPRNVMDWEQPLHFKWQTNAWASSKAMRGRGNEELSSSIPDLVTVSCFACHSHVTSLREIALRLLRLSICERWLHHHHNGSVNSKHTHTTKSICQVLTPFLALDIWARVDKIAQTLICSQTCQFQSLLRDLSPINGRNCSISR